MSKLLFGLAIISLVTIGSCDDKVNQFDLDKDPLKGKIDGVEWEYTGGRVDYSNFSNQAVGKIFNENLTDPCARVNTIFAHLDVAFPTERGNYNLPFINNTGFIKFVTPNGGPIYTATSGFLEIVEVNGFEIIGFISADFDEDNNVQGSFLVRICN